MSTNKTSIKYGKIEIPINKNNNNKYIPKNGGKFIDHGNIMKTLAIAIRDNLPTLLIGESGTGKTSAIRYLAAESNNGLRRINLNGGTTADELIGRLLINEKGTYWVDGVLTEAMRNGEWIVLDEINAALPEVLFVLQSIMDDDGYLVLSEKDDKEIVRKHKDFRLFATCNPPEYAGTKEMNKALLSRFTICINADFPPTDKELEIVNYHLGAAIAKSELAKKLVDLANETRKTKEIGTTDYSINTRDIINTLKLSKFMNPLEALNHAFANKLEPADNKAIRLLAKLHLPIPGTKKQKTIKTTQINSVNDFKIGNTYLVNADINNVIFKLTKNTPANQTKINELNSNGLAATINYNSSTILNKNEKFKIHQTFYQDGEGAEKIETSEKGNKLASIIEITKGKNKGNVGIFLHNGPEILNNIHEIN
jgi:MoxR-like ATPase